MAIAEDLLPVSVSLGPGRVTLGVTGDLDGYTVGVLQDAATAALDLDRALIVDLAQVAFVGSAGVRMLVSLARKAKDRGGDLHLQRLSPSVKRLLDIAGLTDVLPTAAALVPPLDERAR